MGKLLTERRFVTFDSVQIDVDTIQALAYQLQQRKAKDTDGNATVVDVQVAVLMLENGSSVTIGDESLKKFEHWWKENVESEKVELPVEVTKAVAPLPAANTNKAANPPAPAAQVPSPQVPIEPVAATPVKPLETPPLSATPPTPPTPPTAPEKITPVKSPPESPIEPPVEPPAA